MKQKRTTELSQPLKELRKAVHETIRDVTADLKAYQFNTAIARLMKMTNVMGAVVGNDASESTKAPELNAALNSAVFEESVRTLLLLLNPLAPHFSAEAWELLHSYVKDGGLVRDATPGIHEQLWPTPNEEFLKEDIVTITVQVNGRTRGTITVDASVAENEDEVHRLVHADAVGAKYLAGKTIKKVIYVKARRFLSYLVE
jgi:leucyl-tRNA synthetase